MNTCIHRITTYLALLDVWVLQLTRDAATINETRWSADGAAVVGVGTRGVEGPFAATESSSAEKLQQRCDQERCSVSHVESVREG